MPVANFKESELIFVALFETTNKWKKSLLQYNVSKLTFRYTINYNTITQYNLILKISYTIKFSTNQKHTQ